MQRGQRLPGLFAIEDLFILPWLAPGTSTTLADAGEFADLVKAAAEDFSHPQQYSSDNTGEPETGSSSSEGPNHSPLAAIDDAAGSGFPCLGVSASSPSDAAFLAESDPFVFYWSPAARDGFSLDAHAASAGSSTSRLGYGLSFDWPAPSGTPSISGPNEVSPAAAGEAPNVPGGEGAVTPIDLTFYAKGGTPGGGGGTGGGGTSTQYFSGSADGSAGYDIWLDFKGSGWTTGLQDAFIKAADYLTSAITADIGGGGLYRGKLVDDLYVTAELKTIDGAGGVLGQAGPNAIWSATELTAAGQMQFDIADAAVYFDKGLWDDIVTHEMMHVLGFGSLWNYGTNPLVSGSQYTGAAGLAAYVALFPTATFIPVENDGGSGTAGAHWDEQALGNELMTGYINDDGNASTTTDNYLSKFSVMSLADLGYTLNYIDYPYDGILLA